MKYTSFFLSFGFMLGVCILPYAAFADDGLTETPTLSTPVAGMYNTINLSYTLPEAPLNGSVQVSFVNSADEIRIFTMSNDQNVNFSFDPAGSAGDLLASSPAVFSASPSSTPILPDETYTVILSYQDANGNTAATDLEAGIVIDSTAPSEVLDLAAEASSNDVLLTWTNPVSDFASLTIRRSSTSYPVDISDGTLLISDSVASVYEDVDLSDGTYYYSIFTQDSLGNTSGAAQISVGVDTTAPSAPTDFVAVQDGTNVHLFWTNPIDSDFYAVTIQQQTNSYPATVNDGGTVVSGLVGTTYDNDGLSEELHYFSIFAYDTAGNIAEAAHVSIFVDLTGPEITLVGESEVTVEAGEDYVDAGATALDLNDGEVSVLTTGSVDTSILDEYILTYSAVDAFGHEAAPVIRTVHVVDTIAPVLTLVGESEVTLTQGDEYVDAGATALDSFEGDVTESILIDNPVETSVVGTYTITYDVMDSSGNVATTLTRSVTVEAPVTVITTNGRIVKVHVDDVLVDSVIINDTKRQARYVKLRRAQIYSSYKTVAVFTVGKHKAKLTVMRLNADNQLKRVVTKVFDIDNRAKAHLKIKPVLKRIVATIGTGADAQKRVFKLKKNGRLSRVISE